MKNIPIVIKVILPASFLVALPSAFQPIIFSSTRSSSYQTILSAAPKEALPDIVIPNVFNFGLTKEELEEEDPRLWVPQTDCLSFRPLCFCTSQGCKCKMFVLLLSSIALLINNITLSLPFAII